MCAKTSREVAAVPAQVRVASPPSRARARPSAGRWAAAGRAGKRPRRGGKPFGAKSAGPRDDNFGNRIEPGAGRPAGDRPYPPRVPKPQGDRPFNERGPRPQGHRGPRPGGPAGFKGKPHSASRQPGNDANAPHGAEFRSWYVPEGVETGSKVAPPRNARPGAPRPYGDRGPRPGAPQGPRGPRPQGETRGPRPQIGRAHV